MANGTNDFPDNRPVYDLVSGGELGPGVLPADVAIYLLGQVGLRTLKGGLVRFSGPTVSGACDLEQRLFAEVATAMGADEGVLTRSNDPDGTAVVKYDLTRLEPQVFDGETVHAAADAGRPFISIGYLGELRGPALDAVKHILSGREVYFDCFLGGVSDKLAAELRPGGKYGLKYPDPEKRESAPEKRESAPEKRESAPEKRESAGVVTTLNARVPLVNVCNKVYVASAATVAASILTGRLEDPGRLFKKKGRGKKTTK